MIDPRPCSAAAEQNKSAILQVLQDHLDPHGTVLEIGSGTGQHLCYFSGYFPAITWQSSDLPENHSAIHAWLNSNSYPNVLAPIQLDVCTRWPTQSYHAIYSANTAHIMSETQVGCLFKGVGQHLKTGGRFFLYGPFHYNGKATSDSNHRFDAWLKAQDPQSGIRDFTRLQALAQKAQLQLYADIAMPANNRTLIWEKQHPEPS